MREGTRRVDSAGVVGCRAMTDTAEDAVGCRGRHDVLLDQSSQHLRGQV